MTDTVAEQPTGVNDPAWSVMDRLRWASEHWNEAEGQGLVVGAVNHIDALRDQIMDLTQRLSAANDRASRLEQGNAAHERQAVLDRTNLQAFKLRVQAAALATQQGHSNHIAKSELNEWLAALDIPKVVTKFMVTPTVYGTDLSAAKVTADDAEMAEEKVRDVLSEASVEATMVVTISYPDKGDVYWTSENSTEVTQEGMDAPDWLDDVEFSVEEVED